MRRSAPCAAAAALAARLRVLVTAEIVGIVFYRALEVVTDCRRLQILCRTLVADELAHVAFESQLLLALKSRQGGVAKTGSAAWGECLLTGAALLVWGTHRRVLKSAGYGLRLFLRDCRGQYAFYRSGRRRGGRPASGVSINPCRRIALECTLGLR